MDAPEEEEDRPLLSSYGPLSGPSAPDYAHSALDLEANAKRERELLRKLDRRMSIMIVIYVLNYVCLLPSHHVIVTLTPEIDGSK